MDISTSKLGGGNSLTKVPSSQVTLGRIKVKKEKQHRKGEGKREEARGGKEREEGEDRKEKGGSFVCISLVMGRRPNEHRLCWILSPH